MANIYVSARGNLSAAEKRDLVMSVEKRIEGVSGLQYLYATTGGGGQGAPVDLIGQITVEMKPIEQRTRTGKQILEEVRKRTENMAGIRVEVHEPQSGPSGQGRGGRRHLARTTARCCRSSTRCAGIWTASPSCATSKTPAPCPASNGTCKINRELASRFGVNTSMIGTAVQLVTNGIFVARYRPDDSEDEVDIRVRYPGASRGIHALDDLRIATNDGSMVPHVEFRHASCPRSAPTPSNIPTAGASITCAPT